MAKAAAIGMAGFFSDRRGLAAIDYAFVALLTWGLRALLLGYGDAAAPLIRRTLGLA